MNESTPTYVMAREICDLVYLLAPYTDYPETYAEVERLKQECAALGYPISGQLGRRNERPRRRRKR